MATDLEKTLEKSLILLGAQRLEELLDERDNHEVYDLGSRNLVKALKKLAES